MLSLAIETFFTAGAPKRVCGNQAAPLNIFFERGDGWKADVDESAIQYNTTIHF